MKLKIVPTSEEYEKGTLVSVSSLLVRPFGRLINSCEVTEPYHLPLRECGVITYAGYDTEKIHEILDENTRIISSEHGLPFVAFIPLGAYGGYGPKGKGAFVYTSGSKNCDNKNVEKMAKYGAHELGHYFGLEHHVNEDMNPDDTCLMDFLTSDFFARQYSETTISSRTRFCRKCKRKLSKVKKALVREK